MQLYLVQHGDAVAKEIDPSRPLSDAGRRDVAAIADLLASMKVRPEKIFHSGKVRAVETAELLAAEIAPGMAIEAMDGLGPKDPVEPVTRIAGDWTSDVMLVGHLPFMARLVASLVAANPKLTVASFIPGTVVCIERDGEGHFAIAWMVRPEIAAA